MEGDTRCVVCGGPVKRGAKQYCGLACYRIVQRNGDLAARFWSKVRKTATCWDWTGATLGHGYGNFGRRDEDGKWRPHYAHRVAWELTNGHIPDGQWVLHHCDRPPCCRPDHLFLGTQVHNMRDASAKGRLQLPRKRNRDIKAAVIAAYLAGGVTGDALAEAHGIHKMTVYRWIKAATGGADQRFRSGNRKYPRSA